MKEKKVRIERVESSGSLGNATKERSLSRV
jgi:hypothetical protein